jgi:hypothetical protein
MLCQQAHSPDEPHAESDTAKEGGQTEAGAQPKKKGLFKRGWGSKNKSADEKQVKASKSKLGHSTAALEHKSAGSFPLTAVRQCTFFCLCEDDPADMEDMEACSV